MRKLLIKLILFLVSVTALSTVAAYDELRLTHLENYEYSIPRVLARDDFGFLWIGTDDGLLRYDGYNYKKYIPKLDNDRSLSGRNIRDIYFDSKGQLWIGTTTGLNKYDYSSNSFDRIDLGSNFKTYIYDIFESKSGKFWIATDNGLKSFYNPSEIKSYSSYSISDSTTRQVGVIRALHEDSDSNIWLGTYSDGLLRYDQDNDRLIAHKTSSEIDMIIGISDYSESSLLIGSFTKGILIINKRSGKLEQMKNLPNNSGKFKVRFVHTTADGIHWIATQANGLIKITPEKSYNYINDDSDKRSLKNKSIYNIYEDTEGLIWFASYENISVASLENNSIDNYYKSDISKTSLTTNNIFAIHATPEGTLYFGTYGAGIDKISPNGVKKNIQVLDQDSNLISQNINSIEVIGGTLYAATSSGLVYSDDEVVFKKIQLNTSDDKRTFQLLSKDYKLYISTYTGFFSLNLSDKSVYSFKQFEGKRITAISEHSDKFWIATEEKLLQMDMDEKIHREIVLNEFGVNEVLSLKQISNDLLAIGTRENGLLIYSIRGNSIKHRYTESQGLPSNVIYTISEDKNQSIWLSTNEGIAKVYLPRGSVDVLNTIDGLQSTEFNLAAFTKDSLGKFYYGGTEGVSAFYPHKMFTQKKIPKPIWSSIKSVINGEYIEGRTGKKTQLAKSKKLFNTNKIELDYNDITSLEFATNELLLSKNVRYLSRLSNTGVNADWIKTGSDNRQLHISLLPPGKYVFEVKASINGFDWSEPLSVNIIKNPPPWLTWWAYSIYFLILLVISSIIFQKRLQKNAEKQRVQKLIADSEERLKLALWGSRDELWDWNLVSGKIHRSNTWGILNFPKRESDPSGTNSIFRNIHPKDLPAVRAALDDHKNGYTSHYEATYRIRDKDDHWVWILDRGKIVEHDDQGKPLRMSGTIRNITDIRDTQEQLDLIAKAFENTSDGVFILDRDFKYRAVNKAYEKITGHKSEERKERLFEIRNDYKESQDILHQIRQSLVLEKAWQGELQDTRANGEIYTIELKLDAVTDRLDDVTHYVGVFSDITYRKKTEQDLRRMANYDQLTGLPNRSLFQDRLKHAIALSDRSSTELILLFIDLDNFKVVNDSLGHSIGDKLLTKVAERISACVRNNDTVARLGGDEYTILLEQVEGAFVGTRVADKILEALARPFRIQGHELVIGCSIGIATYPDDGADVETLLRNADTAMYSAKYMDKNNYQFFTDSMNKKANTRLEMEHELRKAIPSGDIKVVYQPKIDLVSGMIMGCEALARWEHPELGVVSPEDFIALSEETGLIYSLGEAVLNQACHATKQWKENNNYSGRTAVNLSAMQFRQSGLVSIIEAVLNKHRLQGSDLELEITEGMLVKNPESALTIMTDLRAKGLNLAIDDFGTGYASLAQLKNFPINTLKIDKAFIDDITDVEQDANVVKAILSLAENLGLKTVAEGVEQTQQMALLQDMGCECIQGYLYSRPVSEEQFAELLDKKLTLEKMMLLNSEKIVNFPA